MCEKCPFNQNGELLDTIFQRVNWLEQELQKLEKHYHTALFSDGRLGGRTHKLRTSKPKVQSSASTERERG